MDRIRLLQELVQCASPAAALSHALSRFPWESDEPLVVLTHAHCNSVLERLVRGDLSPEQVEAWANAPEVREEVEFESGIVGEVVYRLANPILEGPLTAEVAEQLRRRCAEPAWSWFHEPRCGRAAARAGGCVAPSLTDLRRSAFVGAPCSRPAHSRLLLTRSS